MAIMTSRQRKRGGSHFAFTCDAPDCPADTDKVGLTGASVRGSTYTLRVAIAVHGWTTGTTRTAPGMPGTVTDFCPDHTPPRDPSSAPRAASARLQEGQ